MGNNFSSKYELFRNVKADDKKGLNKNYGIFLVLRRKTGFVPSAVPPFSSGPSVLISAILYPPSSLFPCNSPDALTKRADLSELSCSNTFFHYNTPPLF